MRTKWRALLLASFCMVQAVLAVPAQASSLLATNSNVLALFQAAGSPNQCVTFAYDKNGNLTVRTNQTYASQPLWGAALFGCFSWSA